MPEKKLKKNLLKKVRKILRIKKKRRLKRIQKNVVKNISLGNILNIRLRQMPIDSKLLREIWKLSE